MLTTPEIRDRLVDILKALQPKPTNQRTQWMSDPLKADGSPPKGGVSTPTGASLMLQAPLTGVASQFSARRQLGAVHGSSSVRLAMHQHTRVYVPKNI